MKKITLTYLTIIVFLLSGCGTKVSYKTQDPLENSSLVYIYATVTDNYGLDLQDSIYKIRINNKLFDQSIKQDEYIALDFKTDSATISITRTQIEERTLKLKLEAGKIYYLRIQTDVDDGGFEFEEVKKSIGMQEIVQTTLAGAILDDNGKISHTDARKEKTYSKTDEIKKAHDLKEKGILSNEEYEVLKAEILAK